MTRGFYLDDTGIFISRNSKTGSSINVDSCEPTPWCAVHCYRRKRTRSMVDTFAFLYSGEPEYNPTPNTGPITWPRQVDAYKRNEAAIKQAAVDGRLEEAASWLVDRIGDKPLRGNGTGDLFPELCEFLAYVTLKGGRLFLFSRRAEMIRLLREMCDDMGTEYNPFVIGSTDPSTTMAQALALQVTTREMNGTTTLAYATALGGRAGVEAINALPWRTGLHVVFGYHSTSTRTVIPHPKACPIMNGADIKCDKCRRCYGFYSGKNPSSFTLG